MTLSELYRQAPGAVLAETAAGPSSRTSLGLWGFNSVKSLSGARGALPISSSGKVQTPDAQTARPASRRHDGRPSRTPKLPLLFITRTTGDLAAGRLAHLPRSQYVHMSPGCAGGPSATLTS